MTRRALLAGCAFLAAASAFAVTPTPKPSPLPVATKAQALKIARNALAALVPGTTFVVLEDKTVEKPFGWVFFYEPKSKEPGAGVPGNGPLVVLREDGTTTFLSTSVPPDEAIAEYEKVWARGQKPAKP